jgi:hypothetical protein
MEGTDIQELLSRLGAMLDGSGIDLVAVISAAVAIIGALLTWRETRRQRKLALEKMRRELDDRSLAWGADAIAALAEAETLYLRPASALSETDFEEKRHALLIKLSALTDQGRFFFPNVEDDFHGAEKEGAYQGKRPPILDALVYAFYEVEAISSDNSETRQAAADFIKTCRRLVVSELQAHLDPKTRNAVVARYNHRLEDQREDSLYRAGKLGLELNLRHHGLLTHKNDIGWTKFAQDVDHHRS